MLLAPSLLAPARGAAITVTVNRDSVSIQMNIQLVENLTTSLPSLDTILDQSSPALLSIQKSFQTFTPAAHIELLSLHANTSQIHNRTGLWGFQENYTIT